MVDFRMLRLKGALHDPWMEVVPKLRCAVVADRVAFSGLREVVAELISTREFAQECIRYTGPQHIKSQVDRLSLVFHIVGVQPKVFYFVCASVSVLLLSR